MNVRSVAITGGSSGIGHATALAFARRGCNVAICARSGEALSVVAEEIEAEGGRPLAVVADVSKYDEVQRFAAEALAAFGGIDVWINNASVAEWGLFEELDPAGMERVVAVDLLGTMYGARAILPHFRRRGGGVIINVASGLAERAVPLLSTYCAAKAGVKGFTDALRMEQRAAKSGIEVVMILPASINTPFYSWGRSRLGVRPHPISVIYPPHVVAEAIVRAARRPQREVYVGAMSKLLSMAQRLSPAMTDRYMLFRDQMIRQQFSDRIDEGESNLFSTPDDVRMRATTAARRARPASTRAHSPRGRRCGAWPSRRSWSARWRRSRVRPVAATSDGRLGKSIAICLHETQIETRGREVTYTIEARQLTNEFTHRPPFDAAEQLTFDAATPDDAISQFVTASDSELVSVTHPAAGRESIATVRKGDAVFLVRIYSE